MSSLSCVDGRWIVAERTRQVRVIEPAAEHSRIGGLRLASRRFCWAARSRSGE